MAQQGQGGMDPAVLDDIICRLLEYRNARPGKQVQLNENEIRQLCTVSKEIFLQQPNLLELEAPIKICGTFSSEICSIWLLLSCVLNIFAHCFWFSFAIWSLWVLVVWG